MGDPKPSVDDLRARLRELGYLDAGVDRFVVGPVGTGRGLFGLAWRSSVRIGLLAGFLLGPSAAIALAVRLPGLVTGMRDGFVVAGYLGALFGLGVFGLALAAILFLGWLAARPHRGAAIERQGARLAATAGLVVSVACLAYLVLWWRTVNAAGTVWRAAAWTWPVIALAAAISTLLGRAVRVSTLAVAAQRLEVPPPSFRLPSRSWRLTVATGVLAFGVGAAVLFLTTRGESRPIDAPRAITAANTGVRVVVVAIDGLDLAFVERMAGGGRIPTLARLLHGARLVLPASDMPDPARTWTSLATGQSADVHGVSGIEARSVSGMAGTMPSQETGLAGVIAGATDLVRLTRPTLVTGLQRRSKTFWEVASDAGLRSAVVNWWATWPAPAGSATVLSDRAALRLERGGGLDAEIAPAALYPSLRSEWPEIRQRARAEVVQAFDGVGEPDGAVIRRAAEQDAVAAALALRVFGADVALRAIYLSGLDIVQHSLLGVAGATGLPASVVAVRLDLLEGYYAFLDRLVGPIVGATRPGDVVVLLTDPGRSASRGPGLLALTGDLVRPGYARAGGGADVAPTVLYLLGLPASRELAGRACTDLLEPALTARIPARTVDSYGRRTIAPRPPGASPLDRDVLERLRSLGYVR
jgi:hypothetical protein